MSLFSRLFGVARTREPSLKSMRMYQPDAVWQERAGSDAEPMVRFIKSVQACAAACVAKAQLEGDGLLVVVAVRPGGQVRSWCELVTRGAPPRAIATCTDDLEQLSPPVVQRAPIAFALELYLNGAVPGLEFPVAPSAWTEAARQAGAPVSVDDVIESLWSK